MEEHMMIHNDIRPDQFKVLAESADERPFVMLNLLKFKKDGGRQNYARYLREASRFLEAAGGKLIFLSEPRELLSGRQEWDLLMLVRYPSRKAFIEMAGNPDYLKIHRYREAALEDAVLYATDEISARDFLRG